MLPFLQGFLLQASLILVIGPQNAFVLRQGLSGRHVVAVCAVAGACDVVLVALGAAGFGTLVASNPWLLEAAAWGGAAFLASYGTLAARRALSPGALEAGAGAPATRAAAVAGVLAVSLLNPHVYLDTVVLVGGLAGQQPDWASRALFAAGAGSLSVLWFFATGLGAARLAPLLARPAAWRAIDAAIALTMWTGALALALPRIA
jgi:L-lysine exporter family protein LysE/ArgO